MKMIIQTMLMIMIMFMAIYHDDGDDKLIRGYTGSKATDEKATSSLFVSCLLVGEKVAFLSAQKATMKFSYLAMQQFSLDIDL